MAFNVLIVDDSSTMRAVVKKAIRVSGFDVGEYHEAADGQEALETLRRCWVDVVLTDINMPRLTGLELVAEMRGDDLLSSVPVIVVSTEGSEAKVQESIRLGARGYIKKPFHPEEIKRLLREVMGHAQKGANDASTAPEGSDF
ncbi:MAG: response regulator [Desulfobacterota bacterium]|jgi:two-component system chemotaxis response regulator CheY|nr:response regulator [Thermodesulfobacteriota bacterium]